MDSGIERMPSLGAAEQGRPRHWTPGGRVSGPAAVVNQSSWERAPVAGRAEKG